MFSLGTLVSLMPPSLVYLNANSNMQIYFGRCSPSLTFNAIGDVCADFKDVAQVRLVLTKATIKVKGYYRGSLLAMLPLLTVVVH